LLFRELVDAHQVNLNLDSLPHWLTPLNQIAVVLVPFVLPEALRNPPDGRERCASLYGLDLLLVAEPKIQRLKAVSWVLKV
jgi:hypothetical protein